VFLLINFDDGAVGPQKLSNFRFTKVSSIPYVWENTISVVQPNLILATVAKSQPSLRVVEVTTQASGFDRQSGLGCYLLVIGICMQILPSKNVLGISRLDYITPDGTT